jgi:hypothetical protein
MEEDDLLGGELQEEQDLCWCLQQRSRGGIADQGGFKGRRTENLGGRGYDQGIWDQERLGGG